VLGDYGAAKTTFGRVSKMLPGSSEVPWALALIAQREGYWYQSVAYHEKALALDPRNEVLLMDAAWTYTMLRQFPAVLMLYDRALDIRPNDPALMSAKAGVYQAQGNLHEAARCLSQISTQTPNWNVFIIKSFQSRLERNYGDAVRLLQAQLSQKAFSSRAFRDNGQVWLALMQRLDGDTAGAKVTAEQACNTIEPFSDSPFVAARLSKAYAAMGEKEPALREAEHAIMLRPRAKDPVTGPLLEENLAFIQATFGENSRAVSTLTQLLQTPYKGGLYATPITPALLRLDPLWDPLRADPAFQKLCEEKQP
jgi:serine/threonine-protein kinase